ncbi:MAG TPA: RidA family protein [Candidatus Binatia bacterium]|nr:RidA family protein [Candidatus Binatia bacterium]
MNVELLNPDGVFKPDSFFQVSIASGSKIVSLSGQVAVDEQGRLIGEGNLAAQSEQVYRNVFHALRGAGASFDQVAKLTVYVPNWSPEKMGQLIEGAMRAAQELGFDPRRPITLVGVAALSSPDHLVEVEAMAVLP